MRGDNIEKSSRVPPQIVFNRRNDKRDIPASSPEHLHYAFLQPTVQLLLPSDAVVGPGNALCVHQVASDQGHLPVGLRLNEPVLFRVLELRKHHRRGKTNFVGARACH